MTPGVQGARGELLSGEGIDEGEAISLVSRLIAIPSVNPRDIQGKGEQRLSAFVARWLVDEGIAAELKEVRQGRANVLAKVTGKDSSRALLLEAHLDTVEVDNMTIPPFTPTLDGGRIYGRGAADCKGSIAAYMLALRGLVRSGQQPPIDIWFLGAVDEEHHGIGIFDFLDNRDPDVEIVGAIVGEPTDVKCVVAHKGTLRFSVEAKGTSAHSSQLDRGENAIYHMAEVLSFIRDELVPELREISHPLLGSPSFSANIIEGGSGRNIIPDRCVLTVERRCVPGEDTHAVWQSYKDRIEALNPGKLTVTEPLRWVVPPQTEPDADLPAALRAELIAADLSDSVAGLTCGTDASKISERGIPFVVFGPGSLDEAHQPVESVPVDEVMATATVVRSLIGSFDPRMHH